MTKKIWIAQRETLFCVVQWDGKTVNVTALANEQFDDVRTVEYTFDKGPTQKEIDKYVDKTMLGLKI